MRPVDRGSHPTNARGERVVYREYGEARGELIHRILEYCSYREMHLDAGLAAEHSFGFRPGRGCKDALRRVDQLIKSGHIFVVDADLKGYFDTIPHDQLMERVKERISAGPVLKLIESFLKADIMSETATWTPEKGAPQGADLSPDHRVRRCPSNIYLNPLDHLIAQRVAWRWCATQMTS